MSDGPNDRLTRARIAAGFETAVDAAEAMRIPAPTYLAHENASRGFSRAAPRYADFFRVDLEWLLTGKGPMKPRQKSRIDELFNRISAEKQAEAIDFLEYLAARKS